MNSKHLLQADGLSHAVDLVPMIDGKLAWDWPALYVVTTHMRDALAALSIARPFPVDIAVLNSITWGGVWDKRLHQLAEPAAEVYAYGARCRAAKRKVFTDGPHFQVGA